MVSKKKAETKTVQHYINEGGIIGKCFIECGGESLPNIYRVHSVYVETKDTFVEHVALRTSTLADDGTYKGSYSYPLVLAMNDLEATPEEVFKRTKESQLAQKTA